MSVARFRIEWSTAAGAFTAEEPDAAQVAVAAPVLSEAYNDPHNAPLMGHEEAMTADDVQEHYAAMAAEGARQFLLSRDGVLCGDADLRHFHGGAAEFAIMVAARAEQGRGLGTRFALMVHAFGFRELKLERIYVAIVPANTGSKRLFEKLGYVADDSAEAREFADEEDDLTFSIDRARFEQVHAVALAEIAIHRV
jgi:RimJ/RimL family protein N-acetyltransferase